jgi:hypothetical protein
LYKKRSKQLRNEKGKFIVADIIGGWTDIAKHIMSDDLSNKKGSIY